MKWGLCVRSVWRCVIHVSHDIIHVAKRFVMQEHSSAKQKQLFQTIQQQDKPNHPPWECPLQLLLDMPVWWSFTYLMLDCAEKLKDVCALCCFFELSVIVSFPGCRYLCTWDSHCWEGSREAPKTTGPSADRPRMGACQNAAGPTREGRICPTIILVGLWTSHPSRPSSTRVFA